MKTSEGADSLDSTAILFNIYNNILSQLYITDGSKEVEEVFLLSLSAKAVENKKHDE